MDDPDPYAFSGDLASSDHYTKLLFPYARKLRIASPLNFPASTGVQYADLITPARVSQHLSSQNRGPSALFRLQPLRAARVSNPPSPLPGPTETQFGYFVTAYCQGVQFRQRRPFTDEELAAVVEHTAVAVNIQAAGRPTATALALWYWYRGMRTFRILGYTPNVLFNQMPPSEAERKRFPPNARSSVITIRSWPIWLAVQGARWLLYKGFCNWMVPPMFQAYSHTRTVAVMLSDKRLANLTEEWANKRQSAGHGQRHVDPGLQQREGRDISPRADTGDGSGGDADEMRPMKDLVSFDGSESQDGSKRGTGMEAQAGEANQSLRRRSELATQPKEAGGMWAGRPNTGNRQEEAASAAWDNDSTVQGIIDDDASPVAPTAGQPTQTVLRQQRSRARQQTRPVDEDSSVPAWERVRQKAQEDVNRRNQESGS